MRQVLVEYARKQNAEKRKGDAPHVSVENVPPEVAPRSMSMIALDQALTRLEQMDARQARVVECRFFAGLTIEETAHTLDVSSSTVNRDWRTARAWLAREMNADDA